MSDSDNNVLQGTALRTDVPPTEATTLLWHSGGVRDTGNDDPRSAFLPPLTTTDFNYFIEPDTWTSGMLDCGNDVGSCCETIWCPYCQLGFQFNKTQTGDLGPDWWVCCGAWFADAILFRGIIFAFMTWEIRHSLRRRWNLDPENNKVYEFAKGCCCAELAQCQVYREMTARGYWPGGICTDSPTPTLVVML
jgi:Cys-rich protein (TIGR01571 family)